MRAERGLPQGVRLNTGLGRTLPMLEQCSKVIQIPLFRLWRKVGLGRNHLRVDQLLQAEVLRPNCAEGPCRRIRNGGLGIERAN